MADRPSGMKLRRSGKCCAMFIQHGWTNESESCILSKNKTHVMFLTRNTWIFRTKNNKNLYWELCFQLVGLLVISCMLQKHLLQQGGCKCFIAWKTSPNNHHWYLELLWSQQDSLFHWEKLTGLASSPHKEQTPTS